MSTEDIKSQYEAVLADLYSRKNQIEGAITAMQPIIASLASSNSDVTPDADATKPNPMPRLDTVVVQEPRKTVAVTYNTRPFRPRTPRGGGITLGAGSEKILREVGSPQHASTLLDELAKLGKHTNIRSLNSTLLQDPRKRFHLEGGNVFGLTEWVLPLNHQTDVSTSMPTDEESLSLDEGGHQ